MTQTKKCPGCGTENPVEANFCRYCRFDFRGKEDKQRFDKYKLYAVITLVVIVISLFSIHFAYVKLSTHAVEVMEIANYVPDSYDGTYSVKFSTGDAVTRYSASIKTIATSLYRIELFSEYGKTIYTFSVQPDGSLDSPQLGLGTTYYKKNIGRLVIKFTKEDVICEFSK